jgi:hypothetical protein
MNPTNRIKPAYPDVDESRSRLHRAGWSLGESVVGATWQVDGANDEIQGRFPLCRSPRAIT